METPVADSSPHSTDSTSWQDRGKRSLDGGRQLPFGPAILLILLASIALWAAIVVGVRALIAAG